MAKKTNKKRPKKKGPAPRQEVQHKPKLSVSQIAMIVVGILVILSMTVGLLFSAFS